MNKNGKKLDQYCHISSGGTPSRRKDEFYGGDILWSTIADMEKSDGVVIDTKEKITPSGLASIGNRIFAKNTLLLAMYGSVGKVAIAGKEMATNQAILGIIPKNKKEIYIPYLKYWFMSNKRKIINKARGGILKNLSAKIVKNLKINLPSYDNQIKIANLLTKVERLISKREESITLLDELLKSTFLDMFGDPVTNPQKRKTARLDEIVVLQRGFDLPKNDRNREGKVPLYGSNGVVDFHDEAKFEEGIITGRSGTIGKVYYSYEPFWPLNTTLFSKDIKGNNIVYLTFLLRFFRLERFHQGAGVPTLNRNNVHKEKIYKVDRDEQDKFATIVQQVETTKAHYQKSLDELHQLFGSLLQRAFKGELDLSEIEVDVSESSSAFLESAQKEVLDKVDIVKKLEATKHINPEEVLNKLIEELNRKSKTEPKKDIEESLLKLLDKNIALDTKEKGKLISGFTFEEIRDKLFELLDNKKITQTFVYKPHKEKSKEIAYVGLKQK